MTRAMLLLGLVGFSACAGATSTTAGSAAPQRGAKADTHRREAMLDRVEGEDTRTIDLPGFGECPYARNDVPAFDPVHDDDIPRVDPNRTRLANEDAGAQSLDDRALLLHLDRATNEVFDCLNVAACYDSEPVPSGEIEFAFELNPAGQVRGVDVVPSASLDRWGVAACARRAIYETEFPAYDGADMVVSYRLELD